MNKIFLKTQVDFVKENENFLKKYKLLISNEFSLNIRLSYLRFKRDRPRRIRVLAVLKPSSHLRLACQIK